MLKKGDKVGITACSNGLNIMQASKIQQLISILKQMGVKPVFSPYIYAKESIFSGTASQRAQALMKLYEDQEIKCIFDISGGDLANEVISCLNFEVIRQNPKPFFGYSDLTTILNAVFSQTGNPGGLYQIRHLVMDHAREQQKRFYASLFQGKTDLFEIKYHFIQGKEMEGIVIGGNIRCFLKLAGTPYMPDFKDRILLLEAMGGDPAKMVTFLNQLRQMNAFKQVKGILLGTFTEMESKGYRPGIEEIVKQVVSDKNLPIARTREIGHGTDAKAVMIGKYMKFASRN